MQLRNMNSKREKMNKIRPAQGQYVPAPGESALVNRKRIAEILGCSPSTVVKVYVKEGMPHFIKGMRGTSRPHFQFNPQACLDWFFANKQA